MRIKSQAISLLMILIFVFSVNVNAANRYINMILRYDYTDHKYVAEEVFVAIDNKKLTNLKMPPIILNDYTLVPAREVFEGVGATVDWKKDLEQVYVKYNNTLVVIPIDSAKAYVNGKATTMQTKAKIINNKTMIPLRFVTTALGFNIEWNKTTRVANIITVKPTTTTTTATTTTEATTAEAMTEATTKAVVMTTVKPTTTTTTTNAVIPMDYDDNNDYYGYDNENGRFYIKNTNNAININNFVHIDDYNNLNYSLVLNGNYQSLFTTSNFLSTTNGVNYVNVSVTSNKLTISFKESRIMAMDISNSNGYIYIKPVSPKEKYDKIIVLDAGHGGSDPGASGNGLIEKNLTLNMLLAAKELFDRSDIKCYVTRDTDVYPSFDDRTNLANEVGDAFISIHINSVSGNTTASGTETYSLYGNDLGNGLTSYRLAAEMLNQLLDKLGTVNRKVKSENWIVLRQSKVPATLIEIGFITNASDASLMGGTEGTSKVGQAIYEGVVNLFDKYPPVR